MKIYSQNRSSSLIIDLVGIERSEPSVNLSVLVQDGPFRGASDGIWVAASELRRFIEDFRLCEEHREGKATLSALSPGEFELSLEAVNTSGQFVLTYMVGRYAFACNEFTVHRTVSGGFEIDAVMLTQNVLELGELLATL
ncbi:MAG TPA: hypothetical protein VGK19_12275 [Capsulimonadaceae bacterium]|jgi:hypothetical protein